MAKKDETPKVTLEREYIVPLRAGWLKVPSYKRGNKAIKTLKEFIARHMKIYDRDLRKIKVDVNLNNELRFRGIKKPHPRIKVKAIKYDNDIVKVELVDLPKHLEFKKKKEGKNETKENKGIVKKEENKTEEPSKNKKEEKEVKEKKKSSESKKEKSTEEKK